MVTFGKHYFRDIKKLHFGKNDFGKESFSDSSENSILLIPLKLSQETTSSKNFRDLSWVSHKFLPGFSCKISALECSAY